jgi:hypothetical protein
MVAYSNIVSVPWTTSSGSGSGSTPPPPTTPPNIPVVNSGWIGSPVNGSTVSGLVPTTVASGTTLASGTLSYTSASSPNNLITLNASVSGSGQIGTLYTTTLQNGEYWIELDAINSTGAPMVQPGADHGGRRLQTWPLICEAQISSGSCSTQPVHG